MDVLQKAKKLAEEWMCLPENMVLEEIATSCPPGRRDAGAWPAALAVEVHAQLRGIDPLQAARFAAKLRKRAEGRA